MKETSGNPFTGRDWVKAPPNAPEHLDDTDNVMRNLALKKIDAFSGVGHGFFFWNFRTDLHQPQWSYLEALDRGWIPQGDLNGEEVNKACAREDSGTAFKCVLKHHLIDKSIHDAVAYAFDIQNKSHTLEAQLVANMTGSELHDAASDILEKFFDDNRHNGATCDFGGVAMLIERNATIIKSGEKPSVPFNDDEYFTQVVVETKETDVGWLVAGGFLVAVCGGILGFVAAMRTLPKFNKSVQESSAFRPLCRANNPSLRSTLKLPSIAEYEEIQSLNR